MVSLHPSKPISFYLCCGFFNFFFVLRKSHLTIIIQYIRIFLATSYPVGHLQVRLFSLYLNTSYTGCFLQKYDSLGLNKNITLKRGLKMVR